MDEMKLKNSILWNSGTNEVIGIVMKSFSTNKMIQESLGLNKERKDD